MFFLSDVIEFKRRKGSKNRKKKLTVKDKQRKLKQEQKEIENNRENIKVTRGVASTGLGASKEVRSWLRLSRMFT